MAEAQPKPMQIGIYFNCAGCGKELWGSEPSYERFKCSHCGAEMSVKPKGGQ